MQQSHADSSAVVPPSASSIVPPSLAAAAPATAPAAAASSASSYSSISAAPLRLSLAQTCFQDGLRSIFDFLLLQECASLVSRVCSQWRSAWTQVRVRWDAQRHSSSRPPLRFHPRSAEAFRRALQYPLIKHHLTAVCTYATEAAFDEASGSSSSSASSAAAGAGAGAGAGASSSSFVMKRPFASAAASSSMRSRCVLSASDLAVLAARVPHLVDLSAQILLPSSEQIDSSEDEEDVAEEAPVADASLVPTPFDPYGPHDEDTFRFPAALQILRVRMESSASDGHRNDDDEEEEDDANPNVPRLLLQISRLQFLHTLVVCLSPGDCESCDDDLLSLLLRPPALRSLTLYAPRGQDHIALGSPSQLWSLPHKQNLEQLALNRGDCRDFLAALLTAAAAAAAGAPNNVRLARLRFLDLSRTVLDDPVTMGQLFAMMPGLEVLSPARWAHSRDWVLLSALPSLRKVCLHLRQEPVAQVVAGEDLSWLSGLPRLTHLSLAHMDLARSAPGHAAIAAAEALGQAIRATPLLRIIHMSHVKLPAHAISLLAACAPALEELSFQRCPLQGGRTTDALELLRPLCFLAHLHTLRCVQSITDATPSLIQGLTYPSTLLPHLHTLSWPPSLDWNHAPLSAKPAVEVW